MAFSKNYFFNKVSFLILDSTSQTIFLEKGHLIVHLKHLETHGFEMQFFLYYGCSKRKIISHMYRVLKSLNKNANL